MALRRSRSGCARLPQGAAVARAVELGAAIGRAQGGAAALHVLLRTTRVRRAFQAAVLAKATAEEARIFAYVETLPPDVGRPFEVLCSIAARHAGR